MICSSKAIKSSSRTYEPNSLIFSSLRVLYFKNDACRDRTCAGAIRDKLFGPRSSCSAWRIYVRSLELVGLSGSRLSPPRMPGLIRQTLPPAVLRGTRGRAAINVDSIAAVLVSFGPPAEEQPQSKRWILNPTLPYEDGCIAVDAKSVFQGLVSCAGTKTPRILSRNSTIYSVKSVESVAFFLTVGVCHENNYPAWSDAVGSIPSGSHVRYRLCYYPMRHGLCAEVYPPEHQKLTISQCVALWIRIFW